MRSLVSHLLCRPELRQQLRDEQARELEHSYGRLLEDFRRPRSIYSQVRDIINQRQTAHQLSTYFDDPLWDDLEDLLGEVVGQCKPIYFYLDALDEEFGHAPMYWLKCQEGLFYQVMRMLRDPRLGGRLHIVVCIRDIVMSSVYRSEHAPRYYTEPHIRVLTWDRGSLVFLLQKKLQRLPPSLLMRRAASGPPTIGDWLGVNGHWPVRARLPCLPPLGVLTADWMSNIQQSPKRRGSAPAWKRHRHRPRRPGGRINRHRSPVRAVSKHTSSAGNIR